MNPPAAAPSPHPPLGGRLELALFTVLLLVAVSPFVAFEHIPVEDGPVHVANAAILLEHDAPAFAEHFEINLGVGTNLLADVVLGGLLLLLPAHLADKVMAVMLVVGLPLAVRWYMSRRHPDASWLAALAIPPAIGLLTYFGFYNFLLGLVVAILVLGWWTARERADAAGVGSTVVLALLLALVFTSHPFPFLALLLFLGAHALDVALSRGGGEARATRRAFFRSAGRVALAAAPTFLAFATFWSGQRTALVYTRDVVTRFKAFPVDAVLALSFSEVPFILAYVAGVGLALFAGLYATRRRVATAPGLPLAIGLLVAVYFLGPDAVGGGSFILPRTQLVLAMAAVFGLAVHAPPRWAARAAYALAGIAVVGLTAVRMPLHAEMDAEIREYLSGATVVKRGATVLPLFAVDLPRLYEANGRRIHPLSERAAYLVATRGAVDLRYFPGYESIFPIDFRDGLGVLHRIGDPERYRDAYDLGDSTIDLRDYEEWSASTVDYVWLWGLATADEERLTRPATLELMRRLGQEYHRVYVSDGGSLEVYARRRSAP